MDKREMEEQKRAAADIEQKRKDFGLPADHFVTPPSWAELMSDIPLIASNDPVYQ